MVSFVGPVRLSVFLSEVFAENRISRQEFLYLRNWINYVDNCLTRNHYWTASLLAFHTSFRLASALQASFSSLSSINNAFPQVHSDKRKYWIARLPMECSFSHLCFFQWRWYNMFLCTTVALVSSKWIFSTFRKAETDSIQSLHLLGVRPDQFYSNTPVLRSIMLCQSFRLDNCSHWAVKGNISLFPFVVRICMKVYIRFLKKTLSSSGRSVWEFNLPVKMVSLPRHMICCFLNNIIFHVHFQRPNYFRELILVYSSSLSSFSLTLG